MKRIISGIILMAVCFFLTSCSYPLKVRSTKRYQTTPLFSASDRPINIGVTPYSGTMEQQWCYNAILEKLSSRPYIGQIQSNYNIKNTSLESRFKPDCVISIEPDIEFKGSGWNYPITFPGFLIFVHAWNGYAYTADIKTKINLYDMTGNVIDNLNIHSPYKFRHCDFNRGFWAGSGWWMPGLGATAFIAGFFMIQYDDGATDDFLIRIKDNYSTCVVEQLYNNSSFSTVLGSLPKETVQDSQKHPESRMDNIENDLNKLLEMKNKGLISDDEYKKLKQKTIMQY